MEKNLSKNILEELVRLGCKIGKTVSVDMTGGGRPYSDWSGKERAQAHRALVMPEPPYAGYGIDGRRLYRSHPYHGLNDNGKRHAACMIYLEKIEEAHKRAAKSKLRFVMGTEQLCNL